MASLLLFGADDGDGAGAFLSFCVEEHPCVVFSHPRVRQRMERLMGSNITRLTDRRYMQRLSERIQEEHEATLEKRIRAREEAEVEREKRLILEGKIPVEQVPNELADHPVFKISRITSQAIETRRSKQLQRPTMRMSYIPQDALTALARVISTGGEADEQMQSVVDQVAEYEAEQEKRAAEDTAQETAEAIADLAATTAEFMKDTKDMLQEVLGMTDSAVDEGYDKQETRWEALQEEMGEWVDSGGDADLAMGQAEGPGEGPESFLPPEDLPPPFRDGFVLDEILGELEALASQPRPASQDQESARRAAVLTAAKRRREHRRRERKIVAQQEPGELQAKDTWEPEEVEAAGRAASMAAQRAEWEAEQVAEEAAQLERDRHYTLSEDEFRRLKYESPLIEQLRRKETVAELYELADEIVGGLWLGKAQRPSQVAAIDLQNSPDDSKDNIAEAPQATPGDAP